MEDVENIIITCSEVIYFALGVRLPDLHDATDILNNLSVGIYFFKICGSSALVWCIIQTIRFESVTTLHGACLGALVRVHKAHKNV